MAEINYTERRWFDRFTLGKNGAGYVLYFSDKSSRTFIGDVTGIDIDDEKYKVNGTSKGNRPAAFVKAEDDYLAGKLFRALFDYKLSEYKRNGKEVDQAEFDEFYKISERLLTGRIVEHIDAIQAINDDKDFNQLAKLIRESIKKNEPEAALDRLHTFMFKFIRELCTVLSMKKKKTLTQPMESISKALKRWGLSDQRWQRK